MFSFFFIIFQRICVFSALSVIAGVAPALVKRVVAKKARLTMSSKQPPQRKDAAVQNGNSQSHRNDDDDDVPLSSLLSCVLVTVVQL